MHEMGRHISIVPPHVDVSGDIGVSGMVRAGSVGISRGALDAGISAGSTFILPSTIRFEGNIPISLTPGTIIFEQPASFERVLAAQSMR